MTNARIERMARESSTSDNALGIAAAIGCILGVIVAALPSPDAQHVAAASPMDAYAASLTAAPVGRMPPPDARATEGNVVDLTY